MKKGLLFLAIVLCLALVACGNTDQPAQQGANTQEQTNNEVNNNEQVAIDYNAETEENENTADDTSFELYSDDNVISFKSADNTTINYYHDGSKITGYEGIVDCGTAEEANLAKADYYAQGGDDDVESVDVVGSTLVIKYKPEAFEDVTLEEIQQTYQLLQYVQSLDEAE